MKAVGEAVDKSGSLPAAPVVRLAGALPRLELVSKASARLVAWISTDGRAERAMVDRISEERRDEGRRASS